MIEMEPGMVQLSETPRTAIRVRDLGMTPTTRIAFSWRRKNMGLNKAIGAHQGKDARGLVQRLAAALATWRGMPVADGERGRLAGELLGLPSGDIETLTLSLLAHLNPDGIAWTRECPKCRHVATLSYDMGEAEIECWAGHGEPPGALYALREPLTLGPAVVRVLTLRPASHGGLYAHHRPGAVNVAQLLADAIESAVVATDDDRIGRLPSSAIDDLGDADAAALDRALQSITLSARGEIESTCPACSATAKTPIRALAGVF